MFWKMALRRLVGNGKVVKAVVAVEDVMREVYHFFLSLIVVTLKVVGDCLSA